MRCGEWRRGERKLCLECTKNKKIEKTKIKKETWHRDRPVKSDWHLGMSNSAVTSQHKPNGARQPQT